MNRKIPATMATQHPDHAAAPYWHSEAFIHSQSETKELFLSLSELGITEYMWDWEGKLVDESVVERILGQHFDFFKEHPLGQEKFLTFRLPNPKVETEFRLGRALMNLASSASVAKHFDLPTPPLFEVILPMTDSAESLLAIQEAYVQLHHLTHPLYRLENILTNLRIIPLFEEIGTIISSNNILREYLALYKNRFNKLPPYMRPFVARSDPALNAGIIPTVLAIKIALSRYQQVAEETGVAMYPIIGAAALPFRGGINPHTIDQFIDEYQGIRTTTIQSAFRYDYPQEDVIQAVTKLEQKLPNSTAVHISQQEEHDILSLLPYFEQTYQTTIESLAPLINTVASQLPKRRERVQHVGLFGYSRGIGKVKLPRAISFTGALYSIGIPPELIGTGRALRHAQKEGTLAIILKHYKYIKENLMQAGKFLNKENVQQYAKISSSGSAIEEDITAIEEIFGISLEPTGAEKEHHRLTTDIYQRMTNNEPFEGLLEQAAILRHSIG